MLEVKNIKYSYDNQYCEKHNVTRTYVVRKGIENVLDNEKE